MRAANPYSRPRNNAFYVVRAQRAAHPEAWKLRAAKVLILAALTITLGFVVAVNEWWRK